MTNNTNPNPITAENLEHMDRVLDAEGNEKVIHRVRLINGEKCRIDTADGLSRIARRDEVFELLS